MFDILFGFDGSCPHYAGGIRKEAAAYFRMYPGRRHLEGISEEAPGMGFRISLLLSNDSPGMKMS